MDFASLMPLVNMLSKSFLQTPQSQPEQTLSNEDREYIKQNTAMFPSSFVPPNNFPKKALPPSTQNNSTNQPTTQSKIDLTSLLPLLNSMSGDGINTEQISKMMQSLNGGGDIGSIINLLSVLSKKNNKQNKQIINNKNESFIKIK